jgi:Xaa-Pro aminopeptidase
MLVHDRSPSAADVTADHPSKRSRVLEVLGSHEAEAVWLTSSAAVSWYLGGPRVRTSLAGDPVAAVRVSTEGDLVRVYENEIERMRAEELPASLEVVSVDWFAELTGPDALAEAAIERPLREARAVLLPGERARYERLCADTAAIATDVLAVARPDTTESELAAHAAARVTAMGAEPLVILVAGESRLQYRHPLPTGARLGARAMIVVCARRHGMVANLTRWVRFGPASADEARRSNALLSVERDVWRATVPGRTLSDVLADAALAYRRHGFDADEWRRHHQGGAAGYAGRDPRATPHTVDRVHDGQAFAWNPTAARVKVEDTVMREGERMTVLTSDDRWPSVSVDGVRRPLELGL